MIQHIILSIESGKKSFNDFDNAVFFYKNMRNVEITLEETKTNKKKRQV